MCIFCVLYMPGGIRYYSAMERAIRGPFGRALVVSRQSRRLDEYTLQEHKSHIISQGESKTSLVSESAIEGQTRKTIKEYKAHQFVSVVFFRFVAWVESRSIQ